MEQGRIRSVDEREKCEATTWTKVRGQWEQCTDNLDDLRFKLSRWDTFVVKWYWHQLQACAARPKKTRGGKERHLD